MLFNIEDNLYKKLLNTLADTDKELYFDFMELKPIITSIEHARNTKTINTKQSIKESIQTLISLDLPINAYQINKLNKTPYSTIKKYLVEVLQEVKNEVRA